VIQAELGLEPRPWRFTTADMRRAAMAAAEMLDGE